MKLKIAAGVAACAMGAGVVMAQDAPFGTDQDVEYAMTLWEAMSSAELIGDDAIATFPYKGTPPHGSMLETLYDEVTVDGHEGTVIVKRNYRGEELSVDSVLDDEGDELASITVMFKREEGYDPDNQNWFWAKYLPDGSMDQNAKGAPVAGRVAKGADMGCIACHSQAPGEDYLYTTNAIAN